MADGFHRVAAHEAAGLVDILAEVREGTKRDALFYALSANKRHGRPMSNADKRKAILIMLKDEEWGISDRYIADKLGVSPTTVGAVRKEEGCSTVQVGQLSTPKTKGADGRSRHKPGRCCGSCAQRAWRPRVLRAQQRGHHRQRAPGAHRAVGGADHRRPQPHDRVPAGRRPADTHHAAALPGPGGLRPQRQPAPPAPHRRRPRPLCRQDEGALPGTGGEEPRRGVKVGREEGRARQGDRGSHI